MPELPEVETIAEELRGSGIIGLKITGVKVHWDRSIGAPEITQFRRQIVGQSIREIARRGKWLVFSLTKDTLLVHLRMTGKFSVGHIDSPAGSHERVRLTLSDHRVVKYDDQRKFGKWYLVADPNTILEEIGPEPLSPEFTHSLFKGLLKDRKTTIKPLLLDQHFIAGLGNIYVDEALWESKIHPQRKTETLSENEIKALHAAIVLVLHHGVANSGTSLGSKRGNYATVSGKLGSNQHRLKVFRRNGKPCLRCGTLIKKIVVAQRGTHFCPECQK